MDLTRLTHLVGEALGKDSDTITRQTQDWDSLDRLEIITHLHEVLGDEAAHLEGLNNFNNLETLATVLREDGILE